jgi:hypothetical protein
MHSRKFLDGIDQLMPFRLRLTKFYYQIRKRFQQLPPPLPLFVQSPLRTEPTFWGHLPSGLVPSVILACHCLAYSFAKANENALEYIFISLCLPQRMRMHWNTFSLAFACRKVLALTPLTPLQPPYPPNPPEPPPPGGGRRGGVRRGGVRRGGFGGKEVAMGLGKKGVRREVSFGWQLS